MTNDMIKTLINQNMLDEKQRDAIAHTNSLRLSRRFGK